MAQSGCSTRTGIGMAIIETIDYLEEELKRQQIFYEHERLTKDRQWLHNILAANPGICYVRVVKTKPEGGRFVKRRYYFDAFLVKRILPGSEYRAWMLYLVPLHW